MKDYSTICIKTNNQAEKLAALYFLSDLTKISIDSTILSETLNHKNIGNFPFVRISANGKYITASVTIPYGDTKVEFSDLVNIDKYITKKIAVKLNDEYTAEVFKDKVVVGCQTFPIDIIQKLLDAYLTIK